MHGALVTLSSQVICDQKFGRVHSGAWKKNTHTGPETCRPATVTVYKADLFFWLARSLCLCTQLCVEEAGHVAERTCVACRWMDGWPLQHGKRSATDVKADATGRLPWRGLGESGARRPAAGGGFQPASVGGLAARGEVKTARTATRRSRKSRPLSRGGATSLPRLGCLLPLAPDL